MIFQEGNTYVLEIPLTIDGDDIDINEISLVEFTFENIRKLYGENGEVIYDDEEKCFKVPLSQEETFALAKSSIIKYQARVKFNDNSVESTCIYNGLIREALSKEVL